MRKSVFIAALILFSCTAEKPQEDTVYAGTDEEQPAPKKKYVYTDTTAPQETVTYDSGQTVVVQAPVEEVIEDAPKEVPDTVEVDTAVYRWQLAVSPDSVTEWKQLRSFAYMQYLDSLLKATQQKKKEPEKEEPVNTNSSKSWLDGMLASSGLEIFLWVLAGGFVLFIIYQLFVTNGTFKRNTKRSPVTVPEAEEEIITAESDFDRMIREAVQQGNYRLAIRYHYLQTLHALAEKNYVQLAADKTNYSYVREINNAERQNAFAGLTLNYEYVWYGEFDIDAFVYGKLKTAFQAFNTTI